MPQSDPFAAYVVRAPATSDADPFAAYVVGGANRRPVSAEDFTDQPEHPEGSAVGRFLSGAGEMLNPVTIVKGLYGAVRHPIDTGTALVGAQVAEARKAAADARAGRYSEMVGHGAAAALPLLGPAAAAAGEQIGSGDIAGGLGKGVGLVAPMAVGALAPKSVRVPAVIKANPAAADALALAERAGVPVDAATATGNRFVKAAQHVSDRSLAGSLVAGKAAEAQRAGLATLGEQLAAKAHARPVAAAEAGSAAQKGVGGVVSTQRAAANDAYDTLRAIEAIREPMPVNLAPVKSALQPIAEKLAAKKAVTGTLLGKEGAAAARIDALLSGPDTVPISVADAALSDLKGMARTNHPDLRTVGQGIAARATSELHQAVSDAAATGGKDAVSALEEGRTATKAKYAAADVLKRLEGPARTKSPTTAFRGMTQAADTNIGHLQDVVKQAPETKPLIARAVLDGLIDHPTAGPAKTWSDWQKLGTETKRLLYTPEHVRDLDAFFKLRKMMADNPNPSGTAHTILTAAQGGLMFTEPVSGTALQIGTAALSSLLHSPAGVRLLTKGMRIPLGNKAAGAAWIAELTAATSQTGSPVAPAPAIAR